MQGCGAFRISFTPLSLQLVVSGVLPYTGTDHLPVSLAASLAGNHSSLRALCHPFRALAPSGGRGGLDSEDVHLVFRWGQYNRKHRTFPYVQEVGKGTQNARISKFLDKTRPSRSITRGPLESIFCWAIISVAATEILFLCPPAVCFNEGL